MKKLVNYFKIALNLGKKTISELISFAYGQKFANDPLTLTPPFTDTQIQTLAATVQTEIGTRATDPSPKLTAKEQQDVDALTRGIMANKNYLETAANHAAAGNKVLFDEIVKRIGYAPYKDRSSSTRMFELVESGPGWAHIRVKKLQKGNMGHAWQWSITTAIGVPPAWATGEVELNPFPRYTLEADVILNGLKRSGIYAVRYYDVLPASKGNKSSIKKNITKKLTSILPVSKTKHPILVDGDEPQWSDFIYFIVP